MDHEYERTRTLVISAIESQFHFHEISLVPLSGKFFPRSVLLEKIIPRLRKREKILPPEDLRAGEVEILQKVPRVLMFQRKE